MGFDPNDPILESGSRFFAMLGNPKFQLGAVIVMVLLAVAIVVALVVS